MIGKAADTGPFARPDGSGRSIRDVLRVGHTLDVEVGPARLSVVFRPLLLSPRQAKLRTLNTIKTPHKLALNVELYRRLSLTDPGTHLPGLLSGLANLGLRLPRLDRAEEAAPLPRKLSRSFPRWTTSTPPTISVVSPSP
ncbi:hypothetical protein GCM10010399_90140 [Dactylosporangium fulvum]